eukprot:478958-Pleurochrysis_carterae.AAC.1
MVCIIPDAVTSSRLPSPPPPPPPPMTNDDGCVRQASVARSVPGTACVPPARQTAGLLSNLKREECVARWRSAIQ